ncbi:hypothetical protein Dred_1406 [Desulforamulus reducens MI-1]|uniref:Uncharacterized protein n=1 Tax=Desulforamulus reducens (strain ATCC BAA-1160 / DSM 100696 / MI-1) TaxID=349161 RepID=A4J4D3_DESRM|nr:hypothetical protein [Desulforamulus reducens]ABO49936.1 hypothetical protein Dred_1406 [Desulforamulus reducens MI-1]
MTQKKYLEQLIAQQSQMLELQKMQLSLLKETVNQLQGLTKTHQNQRGLLELPRQNFKVSNEIPLKTQLYDVNQQLQGLPLSAFKDLRVASITPVVGWTFNYNINLNP